MGAIPLPNGGNAAQMIRRLRAIDAEFYGSIYAKAGVIEGDVTILGTLTGSDIVSSNWDGGSDLSGGRDNTATQGYFLDSSADAAQFINLFADGGELRNLSVLGALTMGAAGIIRTASSGKRIEIVNSDSINFYTAAAAETEQGYLTALDTVGNPSMKLSSPKTSGSNTYLSVGALGVEIGGSTAAGADILKVLMPANGGIVTLGPLTITDIVGGSNTNTIALGSYIRMTAGSSIPGSLETIASYLFHAQVGSAAVPTFSFLSDTDSGLFDYAANVLGLATAAANRVRVQAQGTSATVYSRNLGALVVEEGGDLGTTAGAIQHIASFGSANVAPNSVNLELQAVRDAAGSNWTTHAIGLRRVTDSTAQASLWWYGNNLGVNLSGPTKTLTIAGTLSARPGTTGSAANAFWSNYSGAEYELLRSTSSIEYKTQVDYDVDYLADIVLKPNIHWRLDDKRYRLGYIANDLAAQHPQIATYDMNGRIENYDDRALMAVLGAKINRLEAKIEQLEKSR